MIRKHVGQQTFSSTQTVTHIMCLFHTRSGQISTVFLALEIGVELRPSSLVVEKKDVFGLLENLHEFIYCFIHSVTIKRCLCVFRRYTERKTN